jgi:hypothetical protein
MANIQFFEIINELPVLTPEARTIREFRAIITRDRGSKGDADGRDKRFAIKELAYVYWSCDWRSIFLKNYSEEKREEAIKKRLELPEEWKADKIVEEAITYYLWEQETASLKALQEAEAGLFSAQRLVGLIRRKMDNRITQIEDNENILEDQPEMVDKLYTDYQRLIKISTDLPNQIKAINTMQETVKKEMAEDGKGRKGKTVSRFQV